MSPVWSLEDAKHRLSEVVQRAERDGPQIITRRGVATAVVVCAKQYRRLGRPKTTLLEFFRNSPLRGVNLTLRRPTDPPRKLAL